MSLIFALLLAACDSPPAPPMAETPPLLTVTVAQKAPLDAFYPTDLLPTAEGTLILDGYKGRLLRVDPQGAASTVDADPATWAGGLRLAADAQGAWMADLGARVLHVDPAGAPTLELNLPFGEGEQHEPVAILPQGEALLVSDRQHHLHWLDPQTGAIQRSVELAETTLLTDLVARADGGFYGASPLDGAVITYNAAGDEVSRFGHRGGSVGNLVQPKALALTHGGLFVADSALGIVQLFTPEGQFRAALGDEGGLLRFGHPIAVEATPAGELLVLDAAGPTLWTLRLDDPAVARTLATPPGRYLRSPLIEVKAKVPGAKGETCLQCHDGFVQDSRRNWDPALSHHPVHEAVRRALPAFFPLDEDGGLACETCHSPHGEVSAAAVDGVDRPADRDAIDRGDQASFTRLSMEGSALCVACHAGDPHASIGETMGFGQSHLAGEALKDALARRPQAPEGSDAQGALGCVGCHAVHGGVGESLARSTADGRVCASCHAQEGHPTGLTAALRPSPKPGAALPTDARGHVTCLSCHDLSDAKGAGLLRQPADGGTLCASCHSDTAHAVSAQHSGKLVCTDCHDPHADTADLVDLATTANDPAGCTTCHGAKGRGGAVTAVHPLGVKADDGSLVACSSCHGEAHAPAKAPAAACATCHADEAKAQAAGGKAGHGDLACATCHDPHARPNTAGLAPAGTNPAALRCLTCHATAARPAVDAPRVDAWTHPAPVFLPDGQRWTPLGGLPLYDKAGEAVAPTENGDLVCQSCHLTHGPADGADKLRRPDGWKEACASCHGADSLVLYRYFHQPARRADVKVTP